MLKQNWTEEEIEFLKKHYPAKGAAWVSRELGTRSRKSIADFARRIGITRNYRFSKHSIKFINENFDKLSPAEIAEQLGETPERVQRYIYHHRLKPAAYEWYSEEEIQFLKDNFHELSNTEIGERIGRTGDSVKSQMSKLNLKRTKEEVDMMQRRLSSASWFPKGNEPHNTQYDGYITTRVDSKSGVPYQYIRVSKGIFEALHRVNWEKKHGPIPEGKVLRSIDGDSQNCDPDNWELVDRAEHLDKNSGCSELTDGYIVSKLTIRQPALKKAFAQMPEIIELKRNQIKLRRNINELSETGRND